MVHEVRNVFDLGHLCMLLIDKRIFILFPQNYSQDDDGAKQFTCTPIKKFGHQQQKILSEETGIRFRIRESKCNLFVIRYHTSTSDTETVKDYLPIE